eukprot:555542_1
MWDHLPLIEGQEKNATCLILGSCAIGILWALLQFFLISRVKLPIPSKLSPTEKSLLSPVAQHRMERLNDIHSAIQVGADAFLAAEYGACLGFVVVFGAVVYGLVALGQNSFVFASYATAAFVLGALTSIFSGWVGMKVAVYSNVRTTLGAEKPGFFSAFNVAFRAGAVMGFTLTSAAILILYVMLGVYRRHFDESNWDIMMDCISGYGLGGSSIALFGRVGGGIYTKAADVGADLVGKVIHGIPEDDPRNPAVVADNVGDNVGDVAGMGADLFGSYAEATCASLVISATCSDLVNAGWDAIVFPMMVSAAGILACLFTSLFATDILPVKAGNDVENSLKLQLVVSTFIMIPITYFLAQEFLPETFTVHAVSGDDIPSSRIKAFFCVSSGAVGGLLIGLITEYYTSHSFAPVREVARSCKTGSATNVIYGLSLGYKSVVLPVVVLSCVIYTGFKLCSTWGVALCALGMLSNLPTALTIDAYGPVCDNAGGIAEMAGLPKEVREKTDILDAAGNTTAAVGKGFAIGSAALVSLALYGAFTTRLGITDGIDILRPTTFAFLVFGGMLPYWFSAMTMKAVGVAAMEMVLEVQDQFNNNPSLLMEGTTERPDYQRCISISTHAALKRMIAPGCLVILSPIIVGTFFGVYAVCGMLTGNLVVSLQLAISMSNTGGAWDNAKKYIEKATPDSELLGKGSDIHKAAVVGDTVGDPMKDTSGPSLNILMKLTAITSLVFAEYFLSINEGRGLFNMAH